MNESTRLMREATVPVSRWLSNLRAGRYDWVGWANTKIGAALKALEAESRAGVGGVSPGGVAPTPTPSTLAALIQNVVYCAQDPLAALGAPAHWKPALTADPGYASFVTPSVVAQLRARFGKVGAWFVQTQVPVQHAHDFVTQYGLDFLIFQGETANEYETAIQQGAELIVGNCNAWLPEQRDHATSLVKAGKLAVAMEAYTNLGNPWPDQTSTQGVPAASLVLGVYDGSSENPGAGWNPTLTDYKLHTPPSVWPSVSVYHAAGVKDWGALA